MTTSELIELLQDLEATAGGSVRVQVKVRYDSGLNQRFELDEYDVNLDEQDSGTSVLIDLS